MKQIKYISYIFFAVVLLQSCKKDCQDPRNPECCNYDPCIDMPDRPADFEIHSIHLVTNKDNYYAKVEDYADIYYYNSFELNALYEGADSYYWQIGNEPELREGKTINVFFDQPWGEISLTLFITYTDENNCYAAYKNTDTLTQTINLVEYGDLQFWGKFYGSYSYMPNVIDTVELTYVPGLTHGTGPYLWNFPYECGYVAPHWGVGLTGGFSENEIVFFDGPVDDVPGYTPLYCGKTLVGRIIFTNNFEDIEIKFDYDIEDRVKPDDDFNFKETFIGKRVE